MLHAALLATGLADDLEQRCGGERDGKRRHVSDACGESVQFAAALTGADNHDEEEAEKDRTDGELAGTALKKEQKEAYDGERPRQGRARARKQNRIRTSAAGSVTRPRFRTLLSFFDAALVRRFWAALAVTCRVE